MTEHGTFIIRHCARAQCHREEGRSNASLLRKNCSQPRLSRVQHFLLVIALMFSARSELSASKDETTLASKSCALAKASFSARVSWESFNLSHPSTQRSFCRLGFRGGWLFVTRSRIAWVRSVPLVNTTVAYKSC